MSTADKNNLPKIVVILGPTASGKTDLAIALAKKFNGEIINADSRQVYKKMDIGTAKPPGKWEKTADGKVFLVEGVPHHLMDILDPGDDFTLADFKERAQAAITDILARGRLPLIVGGTGLYVWTLIDNLDIPRVPPNKKLRKELEKKTLPELVALLKKLDPEHAETVDLKNPRRVLRALEVIIWSGESFAAQKTKSPPCYEALQIGISWPREELFARINARVDKQMADGLLTEAKKLAKQKYGWNLPSMTGIGYRQMGYFLRGEMPLPAAVEVLKRDTRRYAKRQLTWFKRDARIKWIDKADPDVATKFVQEFLKTTA